MRTVLFIRHAKSNWENSAQSDFDRPLSERGKKDAPEMAKRLLEKKVQLDCLISSPAKRARNTSDFFAEAYGLSASETILEAELYLPAPVIFFEIIERLPDSKHHIALFSHNPGITQCVNQLTDQIRIDNIPTCGIFAIKTNAAHWQDFQNAQKQFWFFDYPKGG